MTLLLQRLIRIALGVLLAVAAAGAQESPPPPRRDGPPGLSPQERARWLAERQGKLQPGDLAPDFQLKVRGGQQAVKLSSFRGRKAVALIFGSYT